MKTEQITLNEWIESFKEKPMEDGIRRIMKGDNWIVIEWK